MKKYCQTISRLEKVTRGHTYNLCQWFTKDGCIGMYVVEALQTIVDSNKVTHDGFTKCGCVRFMVKCLCLSINKPLKLPIAIPTTSTTAELNVDARGWWCSVLV